MAILNWRRTRRDFLGAGGALSALAGLAPRRMLASTASQAATNAGSVASGDIYQRLGVRTRINAKGTYTYLTGSLIFPEVVKAMEEAAGHYVILDELQHAAGRRIAELLGVEAACVSSGAAGAMTIGVAACVTGSDPEKIKRIPDTTGMKNEVIIQKVHRYAFDHAIRNVGVKLVEVETEDDLEHAINEKTAMLHFLNEAQNRGKIGLAKWVEVASVTASPLSTTPRPTFRRSPTSATTTKWDSIWLRSAAARDCGGRKARDCCWDARTSLKPRCSITIRTRIPLAGRSR
ncbi:MAG TPA: hypothetical protein VG204_06300 [Terriglobia bacterium]|nr:hypothetical protein [Terriglobia bacterium]